ncbi:pentapeptide repeat-containing protein [Kibdelosporangium persicum]|uniref:Pentapeptide repeat-containing protein n=1 Tax=Kibdelosporangium persicum TaxID=2698649 RepID=A0ABX2FDJ4_9PSEU|nr:pentapeptide repeat-containing protein [Kibdelosporangium persicum]NRN69444.1 hypothetical protein [Kibdelosporangium persicum]
MRARWVGIAIAAVATIVCVITTLWFLLGPLASWITGSGIQAMDPKDQLAALHNTRGLLLQAVAGIAVAGGLLFTARNYRLARESQVTDRFSKANGHLESEDETVRAGGIRALDRILADSPRDHDRVLETVVGFLRHRTSASPDGSAPPRLPDDVSAAITTVRLRPRRRERERLDLAGARLPGANLTGAALAGGDLRDADLSKAQLTRTRLTGCDLTNARLTDTNLAQADLTGAALHGATLTGADLSGAKLVKANLRRAKLDRACLANADLSGADMRMASLVGARLHGARFDDADLTETDVRGADLSEVRGLTSAQLAVTLSDDRTRLPAGVDRPTDPNGTR